MPVWVGDAEPLVVPATGQEAQTTAGAAWAVLVCALADTHSVRPALAADSRITACFLRAWQTKKNAVKKFLTSSKVTGHLRGVSSSHFVTSIANQGAASSLFNVTDEDVGTRVLSLLIRILHQSVGTFKELGVCSDLRGRGQFLQLTMVDQSFLCAKDGSENFHPLESIVK